jgi:molybdenum cofactor cytidylyltransferase
LSARVEACVLAAGRGRRMGFAKHLYVLDGAPLLERVVRALAATAATPIRVVLRPGDAEGLELARRLRVDAVFAERADERAASVRAAVRAVSADAAGLLVALADQPFLSPAISRAARRVRPRRAASCARYAASQARP